MFLDPLERGWSLLFWASKIIKIEEILYLCEKKNLVNPSWAFFNAARLASQTFSSSHSILMILDAQKSRDHPLSNGSKNINFRREKVFLRTRWKKLYI